MMTVRIDVPRDSKLEVFLTNVGIARARKRGIVHHVLVTRLILNYRSVFVSRGRGVDEIIYASPGVGRCIFV